MGRKANQTSSVARAESTASLDHEEHISSEFSDREENTITPTRLRRRTARRIAPNESEQTSIPDSEDGLVSPIWRWGQYSRPRVPEDEKDEAMSSSGSDIVRVAR